MKISPLASDALRFERRVDAEAHYFKIAKYLKGAHNYIITATGVEFIIQLTEPKTRRTIGFIA